MAESLPFMNAYGSIPKILDKIKEAKTPSRFTQDFLKTNLNIKSSGARPFLPLAKRLNLLGSDGVPTELYNNFRNSASSKSAMAKAIKIAYPELFERNEYAYRLNSKELEGIITEITGLEKDNKRVKAIRSTFEKLKDYADFEAVDIPRELKVETENVPQIPQETEDIALNLSYTINLVLPKTDDVAVFNAIFKSLRENLLRK